MKKLLLLSAVPLLLGGCSSQEQTLDDALLNPLTASQYGDALAGSLANLIINKDAIVATKGMEEKIQKEIAAAKVIARVGKERQNSGAWGAFISDDDAVTGIGLYVDDMFYLSPSFEVNPLPETHLYLTTIVDPRDVTFPDVSAIDLGIIHSAFGAQTYAVSKQEKPELLRTAVLWDATFKKIIGFAQLSKRQ